MPSVSSADEIEISAPESSIQDGIDPLDLLISIAEHKKWVAKVTVVVAMMSAVIAFLLPNRYTATTRILPPQQNQSLASALTGQLAAISPLAAAAGKDLGLKNPSVLYVGMLKSETVENAIVKQFDLMKVYGDKRLSDARADLEKTSTIATGKEGFITVSVEDKDRKRAASMANAYVAELQKLTQNVAVTEAGQRRLFFEQQLNQAKEHLAEAEQALKEIQQKTGIIQLDGQSKAIIESVSQLKSQIAAKQVQIQAMRSFGTDHNPDIFAANQELAGLQAQLSKLERQQNASDLQVPTGRIPELGLEYFRRARDVKYFESMYELLAKQYEAAKLDEGRQGTVLQVIDPALEPDKKSSPHRVLIILIGAVLGLLTACAWIAVKTAMESSKDDPDRLKLVALKQALLKH